MQVAKILTYEDSPSAIDYYDDVLLCAAPGGSSSSDTDFSDSLASLRAQGYEVLGISPDPVARLAQFREREGLGITLLSDSDRSVMTAYGAFGEKKLYGKVVQGVIRSTFVVDEEGLLTLAQYNVKATGHVAKLQKLVRHRRREW